MTNFEIIDNLIKRAGGKVLSLYQKVKLIRIGLDELESRWLLSQLSINLDDTFSRDIIEHSFENLKEQKLFNNFYSKGNLFINYHVYSEFKDRVAVDNW